MKTEDRRVDPVEGLKCWHQLGHTSEDYVVRMEFFCFFCASF